MADRMNLNVNARVWVFLTPKGEEAYKRYYDQMRLPPGWERPTTQPLETQLWELMNLFGPEMRMGSLPCFEDNLVYFDKPKPEAT